WAPVVVSARRRPAIGIHLRRVSDPRQVRPGSTSRSGGPASRAPSLPADDIVVATALLTDLERGAGDSSYTTDRSLELVCCRSHVASGDDGALAGPGAARAGGVRDNNVPCN
ncbi:MAG: hypothetical protein ACRDSH_00665, partial [Pseudonocardiaceae bacterium]